MFRYVFALVATLVLIGINVYVYKRFLSKIDFFKKHTKKLKWFIVFMSVCEILFFTMLRSGSMPVFWYYAFSSFDRYLFYAFLCSSFI